MRLIRTILAGAGIMIAGAGCSSKTPLELAQDPSTPREALKKLVEVTPDSIQETDLILEALGKNPYAQDMLNKAAQDPETSRETLEKLARLRHIQNTKGVK